MASPVIQFKRGSSSNVGLASFKAGEPGFTTDKYDFYIGLDGTASNQKFFGSSRYWTREDATNAAKLKLVDKNGSNSLTLKAPDTLSGIGTYVFPDTTDGSTGDFLKLNSYSGNVYTLEWAAVPSGSFTLAADSGSNDTFTTGETLTFEGGTNANTAVSNNKITINVDDNISVTSLNVTGITTLAGNIILGDNTSDDITVGGEFVSSLNPSTTNTYDLGTSVQRWRNGWFSGNINVAGIITASNVGVGTTNPTSKLTVSGDANISGVTTAGSFVKSGGTSSEFLKADGSVDSSTYLTSYTETDTLDNVTGRGNSTTNGISVGILTATSGNFSGIVTSTGAVISGVVTSNGYNATTGNDYKINGTSVLSSTTLGSGVVNSSLTSLGTLTSLTVSGDSTHGTLKLSGTSGIGITGISSSTTLTENSDAYLPTQKAVKAYVDALDLTTSLAGDSGTGSVSTSQTLTISGTANEVNTSVSGQTVTIGLPDTVNITTLLDVPTVEASNLKARDGTSSITITDSTGAVEVANNLTVTGNLYVNGSTTQVNTTSTTIEDQLLELGMVDGSAPSSDLNKDIGLLLNYYTSSAKKAAMFWDDSSSRIVFADDVTESSGVLTVASNAYAAIEIEALWVNDCAGQSQVIACSGTTRTLENITVDGGSF